MEEMLVSRSNEKNVHFFIKFNKEGRQFLPYFNLIMVENGVATKHSRWHTEFPHFHPSVCPFLLSYLPSCLSVFIVYPTVYQTICPVGLWALVKLSLFCLSACLSYLFVYRPVSLPNIPVCLYTCQFFSYGPFVYRYALSVSACLIKLFN